MSTASLFLLPLLVLPALAQLTVTFSPANSTTCLAKGASDALTFSTGAIPSYSTCFNFNEVFADNSSTDTGTALADFDYTISGAQAFDSQTNYSYVHYQQTNTTGTIKAGKVAALQLDVFPGQDCQEVGKPIETWYGWSCQSNTTGECDEVPYGVKSFSVSAASDGSKCYDFAKEGKAAAGVAQASRFAMAFAVLAVGLALFA
ncbi:hypothetical protein LTR85_003643 [Meristemomyces frigidus]|nr:hypothetical protein LTR85_003643 [Meristemomyces frigidus]